MLEMPKLVFETPKNGVKTLIFYISDTKMGVLDIFFNIFNLLCYNYFVKE